MVNDEETAKMALGDLGAGALAAARLIPADMPGTAIVIGSEGRWHRTDIWKPAVKAAKLQPDTTFHDLRHTFASTALAAGVPISEVSRWLGHESITTTVDLYGHLVPEASQRARTAMDKVFAHAIWKS
ncbi:tyrosine-type recombinase/integrase [Streptosporangium subroseum]|uniref:tyrosine-type recombinase/integrase n=1 Tax=Streptosporangium subroseum TaxID=106412 RepID=UPI00341E1E45